MDFIMGKRPTGSPALDQYLEQVRNIEWSSSSLGAIQSWPQDLLQLVRVMMLDTEPRLMLLGSQNWMIYNLAYASLAGDDHLTPGLPWTEGWLGQLEIRDICLLESAKGTDTPYVLKDHHVTFMRNGFLENAVLNATFIPLSREDGFYVSISDKTDAHIGGTRRSTLDAPRAKSPSSLLTEGRTESEKPAAEQATCEQLACKQELECREKKPRPISKGRALSKPRTFKQGPQAERDEEDVFRMRRIIEGVSVSILEHLPDGSLVYANDSYFKLSGIPRESAGTPEYSFMAHIYPEDYDRTLAEWVTLCHGIPVNFETRWKAPRNAYGEDYRWVLLISEPVIDEHGTVISMFGCMTDISAHKRAEEERRRIEGRFFAFIENVPVAVYMANNENQMTYANENFFKLSGHPRVAPKDVHWEHIVYGEDVHIATEAWKDLISGKNITVQFRLKTLWQGRGNGPAFQTWVTVTAMPEMDENGKLKQVLGAMTDISPVKFAEIVQNSRVEEAIEARRQQENFIDMTSHEIRNPLGAVVHCADSITDALYEMSNLVNTAMASALSEKVRKGLNEHIEACRDSTRTIISCAAHQKRLLEDILMLSKLDSKLLQIAPSCMQAIDILKDLREMFEVEAQREGIDFATKADHSLADITWLQLDQGRVNQILVNLVTNAMKFIKDKETRQVTVRMGASDRRPSEDSFDPPVDFAVVNATRDSVYDTPEFLDNAVYLWFTVQDTGIGITPAEKTKIFSRFTQGSPRTYSKYGGSGLGLFISSTLASMQGGEIGIASEAGVGSCFAFYVTTRRCVEKVADLTSVHGHVPGKSQGTLMDGNGEISQASVLIVEDNLLNQKVLRKQLMKRYKVYTADNGQEALDFLKTTNHWREQESKRDKVDVILMDIEMPVLDGLGCAKAIREYQKSGHIRNHIPIIAVSANARPEQQDKAIEAGMDDAISKPFRTPDLTPKIDRLIEWARAA